MISSNSTPAIKLIDFNKVCSLVKNDLMTKFADTVLSVGKVNHKVKQAILTLIINFKRNAHKNKTLDNTTINNMVETITGDLKGNNLIPSTFNATIFRIEQKPFTTYLLIILKEST